MIGERIQNYELTALLGEGGMGAVYVGQHPVINRKVAIKVLKRELAADKALVSRFVNEAKAANVIRHPNVVEVMDVGAQPDGLPYIIMEYLEGESLGQRLARVGHLGIGQAMDIVSQVLGALSAAHEQTVVHRDLKPDNVFLVAATGKSAPGRDHVKVLDFGIAKVRPELGGSKLTSTGSLMGTPMYMSPEQCRGIPGEVDHRTDIYAMGAMLFEMLCGRPPFVSEGMGDILVMHMTQAPPRPRLLNPDIPEHVEAVILKALAKNRADRFQSMQDFQAALCNGPFPVEAQAVAVDAWGATAVPPAPGRMALPGLRTMAGLRDAAPTGAPLVPNVAVVTKTPTTFSRSTGQIDGFPGTGDLDAGAVGAKNKSRKMVIGGGLVAAAVLGVVMVMAMGGSRGPGAASPPLPPRAASTAPAVPVAALPLPVVPAPAAVPEPGPAELPAPGPNLEAKPELKKTRVAKASRPAVAVRPAVTPVPSAPAVAPPAAVVPPIPKPAAVVPAAAPVKAKAKKW